MRRPSRVEGALATGLSIFVLSGCGIDSEPSTAVDARESYGDAIARIDEYCEPPRTDAERDAAAAAIAEYRIDRAQAVSDPVALEDKNFPQTQRYVKGFPRLDGSELDC